MERRDCPAALSAKFLSVGKNAFRLIAKYGYSLSINNLRGASKMTQVFGLLGKTAETEIRSARIGQWRASLPSAHEDAGFTGFSMPLFSSVFECRSERRQNDRREDRGLGGLFEAVGFESAGSRKGECLTRLRLVEGPPRAEPEV